MLEENNVLVDIDQTEQTTVDQLTFGELSSGTVNNL